MEELKSKFNALNKNEKLDFIKKIMPELCKIFSENPQEMMKDMMPYCKEMMKDCNMDMSMMMSMMSNMKSHNQ
jgi:hypothetical protein